jgi:hypothetical protein
MKGMKDKESSALTSNIFCKESALTSNIFYFPPFWGVVSFYCFFCMVNRCLDIDSAAEYA